MVWGWGDVTRNAEVAKTHLFKVQTAPLFPVVSQVEGEYLPTSFHLVPHIWMIYLHER